MEHGVLIAGDGKVGGSGDGRGGIARHRLKQDRAELEADGESLLGHEEAIFGIGDHDGRAVAASIPNPIQTALEKTFAPDKVDELLWPRGTRFRPQAGALTPSENDRNDG